MSLQSPHAYSMHLAVDKLNLNRYQSDSKSSPKNEQTALDLDALKGINASGDIRIGQLSFGDKVEGAPNSLPVKLAVALLADAASDGLEPQDAAREVLTEIEALMRDPERRKMPSTVQPVPAHWVDAAAFALRMGWNDPGYRQHGQGVPAARQREHRAREE